MPTDRPLSEALQRDLEWMRNAGSIAGKETLCVLAEGLAHRLETAVDGATYAVLAMRLVSCLEAIEIPSTDDAELEGFLDDVSTAD